MSLQKKSNLFQYPYRWDVLAVLGILLYLVMSIRFAFTLPVILDESAYLFNGYQFAAGVYRPFEPDGVPLGKMPLGYLIYGVVQLVFGVGLGTGRTFVVIIGTASMVGLWLTLRKSVKPWIAVLGVWMVLCSPNLIRTYSQAWSQVLVAFFLVWSLFFMTGKNRKLWHILTAGVLSMIVVLIRQNMAVYPFFYAIYVFWVYGKQTGWINFGVLAGVFLIGHIPYGPMILSLWVNYLPFGTDFFRSLGLLPPAGQSYMVQKLPLINRLQSILEAMQFHSLMVWLGAAGVYFLPFRRIDFVRRKTRLMVFFITTWLVLMIMHLDASVGGNYCVFCLSRYLDFFAYLFIILICFALDTAEVGSAHWLKKTYAWIISLLYIVFLGVSSWQLRWDEMVARFQLPRFRDGKILAETTQLHVYLTNLFSLEYEQSLTALRWLLGGFFASVIIFTALMMAAMVKKKKWMPAKRVFTTYLMLAIIFWAVVTSPTRLMNVGYVDQKCGNVITNFEQVEAELQKIIEPGSEISWHSNSGAHILASLTDVVIHPAQVHFLYTKKMSEDVDSLRRFGLFNEKMELEWLDSADYVLVKSIPIYASFMEQLTSNEQFAKIAELPSFCENDPESVVVVFRQNHP